MTTAHGVGHRCVRDGGVHARDHVRAHADERGHGCVGASEKGPRRSRKVHTLLNLQFFNSHLIAVRYLQLMTAALRTLIV